ncbi:hypothetical protein EMIT048CA2_220016 [Pseudomonas chlororaphis]
MKVNVSARPMACKRPVLWGVEGAIAGKPRSYKGTRICRRERAAIRLARDQRFTGSGLIPAV